MAGAGDRDRVPAEDVLIISLRGDDPPPALCEIAMVVMPAWAEQGIYPFPRADGRVVCFGARDNQPRMGKVNSGGKMGLLRFSAGEGDRLEIAGVIGKGVPVIHPCRVEVLQDALVADFRDVSAGRGVHYLESVREEQLGVPAAVDPPDAAVWVDKMGNKSYCAADDRQHCPIFGLLIIFRQEFDRKRLVARVCSAVFRKPTLCILFEDSKLCLR